jgi:hypothetical protein
MLCHMPTRPPQTVDFRVQFFHGDSSRFYSGQPPLTFHHTAGSRSGGGFRKGFWKGGGLERLQAVMPDRWSMRDVFPRRDRKRNKGFIFMPDFDGLALWLAFHRSAPLPKH